MRFRQHHRAARGVARPSRRRAGGFTLVELMVVIAIIGALLALAVPALTSADYEGKLKNWSRRIAQDIQRARYEAVANHEDRIIKFTSDRSYELLAEVPGTATQSLVKRVNLPIEVKIRGVAKCLALDNLPTSAGGGVAGPACSIPGSFAVSQLKFSSIRDLLVDITGSPPESSNSATLWLQTEDGNHFSRVMVYRTTGNVRYLEGQ